MAKKLISFRKIRNDITESTAILVYKATILPLFDYNDIIYSLLTVQQLNKLQCVQNRALRIVFKGRTLSVDEMHLTARVDRLATRRENHLLTLMFDRTFDSKYRDDTQRVTRRADGVLLNVPRRRTAKLAKAPVFKGSNLWNELPPEIRQAKSKLQLKCLVKLHRASIPLE